MKRDSVGYPSVANSTATFHSELPGADRQLADLQPRMNQRPLRVTEFEPLKVAFFRRGRPAIIRTCR